ncbi:MAG: hypothetical protein Q9165_005360 [Trypethelium subeluteriae]
MVIAPYAVSAAFLYDFLAQLFGILSTPSMKDVHDRNMSFWSPNAYFIGAFFLPQQVIQVIWLSRFWRLSVKEPRNVKEEEEVNRMKSYVPWYIVGNVCIGTWMFFWNASHLNLSHLLVTLNTLTQLTYLFAVLARPDQRLNPRSPSSLLTHLVAKTFAGIGILDLLHNAAAAFYVRQSPSAVTKVLTGVGFVSLAVAPATDWIFGACLAYDLVALSVGQGQWGKDRGWSALLAVYAVVVAGIVGVRNWYR